MINRRTFLRGGFLFAGVAALAPVTAQAAPSVIGLTPRDFDILRAQTPERLAKFWCALNRWEWPEEIPNPEAPIYIKDGRRSQLMDWIHARIPDRLRLRTWNAKMTDEEFEIFWRYHQSEHPEDRRRWFDYRNSRNL